MDDKAARAAEIWAQLERKLVGQLMSGSQLDILRPHLIRMIGDRLEAVPVDVYLKRPAARRKRARDVDVEVFKQASKFADDLITGRLNAMLDQSCSRRMGYDGDDEVTYAEPR